MCNQKPLFQLLLLNSKDSVKEFIISNGKGPKPYNPFIKVTDKKSNYFVSNSENETKGE